MNRIIFHLDVDAFFAQVEQLLNPSLKGKPVIVGHTTHRGVVASASYEARAFGVHSAMPITQAKRLCPQAIFVKGNFQRYEEISVKMAKLLYQFTPLVEMASLDEAYLDVSHYYALNRTTVVAPFKVRRLKPATTIVEHTMKSGEIKDESAAKRSPDGCRERETRDLAQEIKDCIKQHTGLTVSIGIGPNKLIAKIASGEAKPDGIKTVLPGEERNFLAPLPVKKLPGVGPKTGLTLEKLGVKTIEELSKLPERALKLTFGVAVQRWRIGHAGLMMHRSHQDKNPNQLVGRLPLRKIRGIRNLSRGCSIIS